VPVAPKMEKIPSVKKEEPVPPTKVEEEKEGQWFSIHDDEEIVKPASPPKEKKEWPPKSLKKKIPDNFDNSIPEVPTILPEVSLPSKKAEYEH